MPANLPPEYYKLKHQLEVAQADEERIQLLEEMLRITPKHKGSEKVISDLRRRAAKLRNAPEKKGAYAEINMVSLPICVPPDYQR